MCGWAWSFAALICAFIYKFFFSNFDSNEAVMVSLI